MKNKKSSWLSYIAPYLIILLIILAVSFVFGGNKSTKWNYTAGDIITGSSEESVKDNAEESVLWTDNIQTLSIEYNNGNFIDVSGTVKKIDSTGKESNFAYAVRLPNDEHTQDVLAYIVTNRVVLLEDGSVAQYYTTSNFQIVDPNEGNFWTDVFPTILISVIGIGVLIFLVTRMSGAVSKSNSQAMDFNKSRAKREDYIASAFGCLSPRTYRLIVASVIPVKCANWRCVISRIFNAYSSLSHNLMHLPSFHIQRFALFKMRPFKRLTILYCFFYSGLVGFGLDLQKLIRDLCFIVKYGFFLCRPYAK